MHLSWDLRIPRSRRRPWTSLAILALSLLTPINMAAKSASDYYVSSLPGAPEGPLLKMHAGHIETDPENNSALFFWHYQNRHIGDRQRTVIWLNGGPGCSSMDGALMEIGPYRVRKDGKLVYNEGSWDEFANLLFVDNPVGTGFSLVGGNAYVHDLDEMAAQFVIFLEKWFELFPEYERDDIYIAGESYAGQYIPYIADAILKRNGKVNKRNWNVKGLLIGNGWISPQDQYSSYTAYAYEKSLIDSGSAEDDEIEDIQLKCYRLMKTFPGGGNSRGHVSVPECEKILIAILEATRRTWVDEDKQCLNMYDTRKHDSFPSCGMNWPPDLAHVTPYLRDDRVLQALNVDPSKKASGWTECAGQVSGAFSASNSMPSISLLPKLLKEMPILLFSGNEDLICNHIGTETLIDNLSWNGGKGFETSGLTAPRLDWTFEGKAAGIWQEARNLTYVLFYESSHMVPFDHPRRTRDMLDRFMGVDIASVGGRPMDSRIGGDKGVQTSVGGHPNSTAAEQAEAEKLSEAKLAAYYRSGEVALIIVVLMAGAWGWYVWRERRRMSGYGRVDPGSHTALDSVIDGFKDFGRGAMRMEQFRHEGGGVGGDKDLEAADFDESEIDDADRPRRKPGAEPYADGHDSTDDEEADDSGKEHSKGRVGRSGD